MRKFRIGFVNTHPIQYFAPLYAHMNRCGAFEVVAFYLSNYSLRGASDRAFDQIVKWDVDLLEGYEARFISGAERRGEPANFFSMIAPALWREVRGAALDAIVVHGHTPAALIVAIAAAKSAGVPVFMRAETHLGLHRSPLKRVLRDRIMRWLYRQLSGTLAIGSANADFYRALGVPDRQIFLVPYTVDNERFMRESVLSKEDRTALRRALGVDDDRPIVLFSGKLQARKRPDDLIRAAARLRDGGAVFHLVIVGSGEMESDLRSLAARLGLTNIHFQGFVNQSALPRIYAACDLLAFPSENEPWGLVVNEAMCAGLPIIASAEIGCVPDLVREGENGMIFDAGDIDQLCQSLGYLIDNPELRSGMGQKSREIIKRWSYNECCNGIRSALGVLAVCNETPHAAIVGED